MKLILLIAIFCLTLEKSSAKPGHMMLKYYQKQVAAREHGELRIRCKSQISRGFVSDRRCQEWIENITGSSQSTISNLGLTSVCLIFAMISKMIWR